MHRPLTFSQHARDAIDERKLDVAWVKRTIEEPDWIGDDLRPGRRRYFKVIPEFGNRVLRVVCVENEHERRIITIFFDRDARQPT
ncbi:DUF4258 domain-containing protein [Mangrovicella endophytica]|uniref:DUF4258 domain-containing protein n=1 Tax=Mangrovicella endophytica TaxID=2066697 RepID=UPI000C9E9385|nr:DUF4258 domain-containing protein [Mangrovicella endophytica]